jgi:hypothetical protein
MPQVLTEFPAGTAPAFISVREFDRAAGALRPH